MAQVSEEYQGASEAVVVSTHSPAVVGISGHVGAVARGIEERAQPRVRSRLVHRCPRDAAGLRLRLLVDLAVLCITTSAAVFAVGPIHIFAAQRWLGLIFPVLVLVILHAGRSPEQRLDHSLLDTTAHVTGAVS